MPRGGPWQYAETDWAALDLTDEEFGGDYSVSQWVGEQLQQTRDRPFFLACGIYRPHEPWFVPQKYIFVGAGQRYLFDLEHDQHEHQNVIDDHLELRQSLHEELEDWSKTLSPPGRPTGEKRREQDWYELYFDNQ